MVGEVRRPQIGDSLVSIGPFVIRDGSYSDYIQTLRGLSRQVGDTIEVRWRDQNTEANRTALVKVQYPPSWTYYRSCVWFLQELLIFAIGARVLWKRPDDNSAQLFFAVCFFTVGAFMGGYHWTEIVTEPLLIYPFALFRCVRAGCEPPFLPGIPSSQSRPRQAPKASDKRPLRYNHGLFTGALGKHVRGAMVGA